MFNYFDSRPAVEPIVRPAAPLGTPARPTMRATPYGGEPVFSMESPVVTPSVLRNPRLAAAPVSKKGFLSPLMFDDLLFRSGKTGAFIDGPYKTLKRLNGAYREDPDAVIAALDSGTFPFTAECAAMMKLFLTGGGKFSRETRYANYHNFCMCASKWNYAPSKKLTDLLKYERLSDREQEYVALTFPISRPDTIRKVAIGTHIALDNNDNFYVIQTMGIPKAYELSTVLAVAHYVLRWASSTEDFPKLLAITPLVPPRGKSADVARTLSLYAREMCAGSTGNFAGHHGPLDGYAFYHKYLLPETMKIMSDLMGIIQTRYGISLSASASNDDGNGICNICLSYFTDENFSTGPPTAENPLDRRVCTLPCTHEFHRECIAGWYQAGRLHDRCPNCRRQYNYADIQQAGQDGS